MQGGGTILEASTQWVAQRDAARAYQAAADKQSRLIKSMEKRTEEQMDPALVNQLAYEYDVKRAQNRLALQRQIDPALAELRGASEKAITSQLSGFDRGTADQLAELTAAEATGGVPGAEAMQSQLMSRALENLKLGATLPPDVQAELMQAGLEGAGAVTGRASGAGIGGTLLRQVLGSGALNLQAQRRQEAQSMATAAMGMESQRQNILQALFPKLKEQQLQNLQANMSGLQLADTMTPEAGLGGQNIANIWLSRLGALNDLTMTRGNIQAQGYLQKKLMNAAAVQQAGHTFGESMKQMGGSMGGGGGGMGGMGGMMGGMGG